MASDIDIAGLRELEKKASEGVWFVYYATESHIGWTIQHPDGWLFTSEKNNEDDSRFIVALRNAAPQLLALAEIGQAVQKIRPDEWEYMLKTFEAGNDRQWAIACEIRKALPYLARKDEQ